MREGGGVNAVAVLSRSARAAGYLGCGGRERLPNGLNGDWREVVEFDVSVPVEGFDAVAGGWRPSLAAPVRYVKADQVGGARVRAVQFQVTATSIDAVTAADQPLRRTYPWTVALRNA